jgi:hypothetical protein
MPATAWVVVAGVLKFFSGYLQRDQGAVDLGRHGGLHFGEAAETLHEDIQGSTAGACCAWISMRGYRDNSRPRPNYTAINRAPNRLDPGQICFQERSAGETV